MRSTDDDDLEEKTSARGARGVGTGTGTGSFIRGLAGMSSMGSVGGSVDDTTREVSNALGIRHGSMYKKSYGDAVMIKAGMGANRKSSKLMKPSESFANM